MPATEKPTRLFIADFRPNERFEGSFSIGNAQLAMTKNGDPYLACLLGDKTGSVPARRWQMPPELFRQLPTEGFVYAEGRTQPFKGELQLIVEHIEVITPTAEQLAELLPSSDRSSEEMFAELRGVLEALEHPAVKALAAEYLNDEPLMDLFKQAPAAKMLHHAYIGGLLEHTLQLLQRAEAMLPRYPKLSRDVVLMGLFLHDLGKTRELSWGGAFGYTDRGELVGHVVEGAIMLHDKAQQVMVNHGVRLPKHLLNVLQHIVVSHHGRPEFGAAKIPATPEAVFVAMLDDLDAKTEMALRAARPDRAPGADLGGNFTERHWALETKLFRPDPLS